MELTRLPFRVVLDLVFLTKSQRFPTNPCLLKHLFHFAEESSRCRLVLDVSAAGKLFHKLTLPLVELRRGLHNYGDDHVSTAPALQHRHASPFDLKLIAALRSCRDLKCVL